MFVLCYNIINRGDTVGDRIILHCDCDGFFASVEQAENPELKKGPMAVAGNPENRTGIILAKNQQAKEMGVKTAEPICRAKRKCPGLVCVPPRHYLYSEYCERINQIYLQYTDLLEPFSIDESFLDVTGTIHLFGCTPRELADSIRERIYREIGVTVSVGVSFCKAIAKLGSDYNKPNGTTVIDRDNFSEIVYPLPVSKIIFAGEKTTALLSEYSVNTCGELAMCSEGFLNEILGKQGEYLYRIIHCMDDEPVRSYYDREEAKSIGNSITFPKDLSGEEEIRSGVNSIADMVSSRLRHSKKKCYVIRVGIKDTEFRVIQRQKKLEKPIHTQKAVFDAAMNLIRENWDLEKPIRLISITADSLCPESEEAPVQLSLFDMAEEKGKVKETEQQEKIDAAVDAIREKYGSSSIRRLSGKHVTRKNHVVSGRPHKDT